MAVGKKGVRKGERERVEKKGLGRERGRELRGKGLGRERGREEEVGRGKEGFRPGREGGAKGKERGPDSIQGAVYAAAPITPITYIKFIFPHPSLQRLRPFGSDRM